MRVIIWLCFSLLSAVLTASVSSAGERDLRARKFVQMGCERGIERWSKTAEGLGKILSDAQGIAKTDRAKALAIVGDVERQLEEIENNEYLEDKRLKKEWEERATREVENAHERTLLISSLNITLTFEKAARNLLFTHAYQSPGKSAAYYARMAEGECLAQLLPSPK